MSTQSKKKKKSTTSKQSVPRDPNHAKHVHVACSITNPFCPAARNAHHPDGRGNGTVAFQVRAQVPLQTDAAGNMMVVFVPGIGRFGYAGSGIAAGNATINAAWVALPSSNFINTNADEVRIVSWGVNFKSIASMTNCSGLVHTFVTNSIQVGQVIPQMSNNNLEDASTTMTSGFQTSFVGKPVGSAAEAFRKYSEATTTMSQFDWTCFGIEIIGGPFTITVGYAEIVVNVEFTLNNTGVTTTGLAGVAPINKGTNPLAVATSRHVQSSTPSLVEGSIAKVESLIYNKASSFLEGALNSGVGYLAALL